MDTSLSVLFLGVSLFVQILTFHPLEFCLRRERPLPTTVLVRTHIVVHSFLSELPLAILNEFVDRSS